MTVVLTALVFKASNDSQPDGRDTATVIGVIAVATAGLVSYYVFAVLAAIRARDEERRGGQSVSSWARRVEGMKLADAQSRPAGEG
ncbi:hypothetical protein ACFVEN_34625 [Streptomyces sp. NPDC057681]|uniref:hypothetical protein n=1 Tax=Streptomyces sp. NPDC057681 TaxID=3346209 RepID=UPI0036B8095B